MATRLPGKKIDTMTVHASGKRLHVDIRMTSEGRYGKVYFLATCPEAGWVELKDPDINNLRKRVDKQAEGLTPYTWTPWIRYQVRLLRPSSTGVSTELSIEVEDYERALIGTEEEVHRKVGASKVRQGPPPIGFDKDWHGGLDKDCFCGILPKEAKYEAGINLLNEGLGKLYGKLRDALLPCEGCDPGRFLEGLSKNPKLLEFGGRSKP